MILDQSSKKHILNNILDFGEAQTVGKDIHNMEMNKTV